VGLVKETIRAILFPIAVACGGDFYAESGTLLCKFFLWLYGEECAEEIEIE
jgi:hypothetical protein